MTIDPGAATLIGIAVVGVMGIAFGYGMLTRSVKGNRADIDENKRNFNTSLSEFRTENAAGHKAMYDKLDVIIRNGGGKT